MKKNVLFSILIITAIVFLIYLPALSFYFSRDDFGFFPLQNYPWSEWWRMFVPQENWFYRPLSQKFYFFAMYKFFGLNASAYHLVNLFVHAINGVLVYAIAKRVLKDELASLTAGVFFIASRIHLMSVYWISAFTELSGTMFYFLTFLLSLLYQDKKKVWVLVTSLLTLVLGLLCREMLVTLPGVVFLYLLLWNDQQFSRTTIWRAFKGMLPYGLVIGAYLFIYLRIVTMLPSDTYSRNYNPIITAKTALKYTASVFITSADKERWISWLNFFIIGRIGLIGLMVLMVVRAKGFLLILTQYRVYIFGFLWFYTTMVPVVFIPDHAYPYYLSIPILGLCLVIGQALTDIFVLPLLNNSYMVIASLFIGLNIVIGATNHTASSYVEWVKLMQEGARVSASSLSSLPIQPNQTIYITPSHLMSQSILFFGELIRAHYIDYNLKVQFLEEGDVENLPESYLIVRFNEDYTLTDVTTEYVH